MAQPPVPSSDPESLLQDEAFVRRLARQLVRDEDSAQDLAQATWLQWAKRPAEAVVPRAWLATVARRLAGRAHRTRLRREARERMADAPAPVPTPEQVLAREELRATVVRAVLNLSPIYRDVVVLRFFEGLPPREIAERLTVSVETVRTRQKRALQELRARLGESTDGGRAEWLAVLLPLAGFRAEAVGFAAAKVSAAMAKAAAVWIAAAVATVGVTTWAVVEGVSTHEVAVVDAQVVRAETVSASMPESVVAAEADGTESKRIEVPPVVREPDANAQDPGASANAGSSTARVAAWTAQFLVVDATGVALPGAEIRLYEAAEDKGIRQSPTIAPFATMVSGENGRAEALVPFERCVFAVADPSSPRRRSGDFPIASGHHGPWRVVLEEPVRLAGHAVDALGQPLAGADVRANPRPLEFALRGGAWIPEPVVAAADGSFAIDALPGLTYDLVARRGDLVTESVWVLPQPGEQAPLRLAVSGRAVIAGVVLDDVGQGVAGADVHVVRARGPNEVSHGRDSSQGERATTAADGSFSVVMPRHGTFHLVAQRIGFASSQLGEVGTNAESPAAHATLALTRYVPMAGRVVDENGAPLADVMISLSPQAPASSPFGGIRVEERFGAQPSVTRTDAAGAFSGLVHPGCAWDLRVQPVGASRELYFLVSGVAAGRTDVLVRMTQLASSGCVLRGRVVAPEGGTLPPFDIHLWEHQANGRSSAGGRHITIEGDRFTTEPLPLGSTCSVELRYELAPERDWQGVLRENHRPWTEEFAPSSSSRIVLDAAMVDCELVVRRWGSLRLRVRDGSGQPVRTAIVSTGVDGPFGIRSTQAMGPRVSTDPDGVAVLTRCEPGTNHVVVRVGAERVERTTVEVRAGEEAFAEVVIAERSAR